MSRKIFSFLLLSFVLCPALASADDGAGGDTPGVNKMYDLGFQIGNLLPNQINGVTEIMGMGGVYGAFRLAPLAYAEGGVIMGNGNGVEWKNVHADVRMDIPVENLVGLAYVGADTILYKGNDGQSHLIFGGHAGGGIQVALSDLIWLRTDMKFSFSPGTSLYVGAAWCFDLAPVAALNAGQRPALKTSVPGAFRGLRPI